VLGPRLAAVAADQHAVARIAHVVPQRAMPRLVLRRWRRRAFRWTEVMLNRHQDAAVAGHDVIAEEGEAASRPGAGSALDTSGNCRRCG